MTREYVTIVPTLSEAVRTVSARVQSRSCEGILIDPHASVQEAHQLLERIKSTLTARSSFGESAHHAYADIAELQSRLALPTTLQ